MTLDIYEQHPVMPNALYSPSGSQFTGRSSEQSLMIATDPNLLIDSLSILVSLGSLHRLLHRRTPETWSGMGIIRSVTCTNFTTETIPLQYPSYSSIILRVCT